MPSSTSMTSASSAKTIAAANVNVALGAAAFVGRRRASSCRASSGSASLLIALRALLGDRQPLHVRQDRVDAGLVGGEALLQLGQRRARFLVADRRAGAASRCPSARPFRMSRNVPVSLPSRNATSGSISSPRRERVRVLRDPLRQHRRAGSRTRARAAAAAPAPICCAACCASSSSALLPWLIAVEALRERRQALLVVEQALGGRVDPLPARLDAVQQRRRASVLRDVERRRRARCRHSGARRGSRRSARGCP